MEGYTIRRLTPTECGRLQGFPDWWCEGLGSEPSEQDMEFWSEVFTANGKPKSRKQLERWIRSPHSDSAEYMMWGNGVALPNVDYVMAGIAYWSQQEIADDRVPTQMTIDQWMKEMNDEPRED